ncbi:hypothetical protein GGU11DRAFT_803798 [Lentinula aff. detonsa]|uniref:BTB domain-containing protein n=1 Tax=Lentinula aff. detonsa TaxID=2804958 RepID=A0AA38NCU5_9AGAR|nr:hypothetical protein GGU10DRAFT_355898 [Lentinula aff. detonsa]KAJ3791945.1 hypothetical protein GGU11DRAFT_803798 [Lentinula aff. detonsa]
MEITNWDSVLQFASGNMDLNLQEHDFSEYSTSSSTPNLQVPTPPHSTDGGGSPVCDDPSDHNVLVSISTTFYPGANLHSLPPDLALLSSDSVFFYVHSHIILAASDNSFLSLIPTSSSKEHSNNMVIHVPELSPVLNIILHIIYDKSCSHYSPSLETLSAAVNRLPSYGIDSKSRITPSTPIHTLLLSHAPLSPLEVYTLAAKHDLYDLAVPTSSHLLSFQLSTITDDIAEAIGPKYLRRMFFLHIGRSEALKRILLQPPHPHAPTPWCDFTNQKTLTRAWALASAYLAWDARPDISTGFLEAALAPLAEHLSCDLCKQGLNDRIKNLIVQWSVVKRTI